MRRTGAVFVLSGCAYTVERAWGHGASSTHLPPQASDTAGDRARFRSDLTDCVAMNDPEHLYELDDGGEYQLSGWFLSSRRGGVMSCLCGKGYVGVPKMLAP